jgi:hypothetical protein
MQTTDVDFSTLTREELQNLRRHLIALLRMLDLLLRLRT